MVSTPHEFKCKIPLPPDQYDPNKNTSARKPLCQFYYTLDTTQKTDVSSIGAAK